MMASSLSAVLTGRRNNNTRLYVIIITIILLDLSITSVESSIHSVQERFTARVGDTVNIPFEYCANPKPSCTLTQSFNLSSPNPTCTVDRYGHCEVGRAADDDPFREGMDRSCDLCVLRIHGVTQKDAGRYAICQTSGACTSSFWSTVSTLKVEEPPTSTDSTSTKVSTKPTPEKETASSSTMTVKPSPMLSTKYTEKVGSNDSHLDEKHEHLARNVSFIAVGVYIAVIAPVAVIWINRRVRKRHQRSKSHHQEYKPGHPMGPSQSVAGNGYAFNGYLGDDATRKSRL